jgi:hypothetical protein
MLFTLVVAVTMLGRVLSKCTTAAEEKYRQRGKPIFLISWQVLLMRNVSQIRPEAVVL